ncbi:MAG: cyclic nucleotide-binding domain-containing protein [Spirulina sp. SIO3F2]|nr:cyclic nucleotide-binding domain-containing protein [Spirulina sp. SIO3F2]
MNKVFIDCLEEGIYQLKIDDPENENRLNEELSHELVAAFDELVDNPRMKILILTGSNGVFCAGGSLEFLRKLAAGKSSEKDLFLVPNRMLDFPVPIIGALSGHAVGGGLTMALYCDAIIASKSSRYGVNFANMGFTPGMGTTSILPTIVGHHFASEMILTGKLYKGRELAGRGLFNDVVPTADVLETALDMARRIAEKPRYVLEMMKDVLALPRRQALQEAMAREHLMHKICFDTPETASIIEATYLASQKSLSIEDFWQVLSQQLHDNEVKFFANLTEFEIKTFLEASTVLQYKSGDYVIKAGALSEGMFILLSGTVEVCKQDEKTRKNFVLSTFHEGQIFGEMAFVSQMPRTADVVALTDIEVLMLSKDSMQRLMREIPAITNQILFNLSLIMCDRIHSTTQSLFEVLNPQHQEVK